jgi:hypothetical protein
LKSGNRYVSACCYSDGTNSPYSLYTRGKDVCGRGYGNRAYLPGGFKARWGNNNISCENDNDCTNRAGSSYI